MAHKDIALELRYPDAPACSCKLCKAQCHRPGWMTVEEAKAAIAAGYGDRLMIDYLHLGGDQFIGVLCPAYTGREGKLAEWSGGVGGCVLQTADGLCEIHDSGFKPLECRTASHDPSKAKRRPGNIKEDIAREWMSLEGVLLLRLWHDERNESVKKPRKSRKRSK